jgi:hypothetical protein
MPRGKSTRPQDITSVERSKRVEAVKQMLLQGFTRSSIIKYCNDNFKVKEITVDLYISDAKAIIRTDFQALNDDTLVATIYGRLEDLFQKNEDIQDFKEQRNILKDIRDLLGVDQSKINKTILEVQSSPTQDQIDKLIDKL